MRKITQKAIEKMNSKENMKSGNTEVFYSKTNDTSYLSLHGNTIAILTHFNGKLQISSCGWLSNTTKERLNGFNSVNINQKNFEWFLNGEKWNGDLIEVKQ